MTIIVFGGVAYVIGLAVIIVVVVVVPVRSRAQCGATKSADPSACERILSLRFRFRFQVVFRVMSFGQAISRCIDVLYILVYYNLLQEIHI